MSSSTAVSLIKRHTLVFGVLCLLLLGFFSAGAWSYSVLQSDTLLPGIRIAGTEVGGETQARATALVNQALATQQSQPLTGRLDSRPVSLGTSASLIRYDVASSVTKAAQIGRTGSLPFRLFAPLIGALKGYDLPIQANVNAALLAERVQTALGDNLNPPQDADLRIQATATSSVVSIQAERSGLTIDIPQLKLDLEERVHTGSSEPVVLISSRHEARVTQEDLVPLIPTAQAWLDKAPFTLTTQGKQWTITRPDLAAWINVATSTLPVHLQMDPDRLAADLRVRAKDFVQPVHDGSIQVNASSTVIAFETPTQGIDIDTNKTIENIMMGWQNGSSTINLVLTAVNPSILGDGERLGIREVIGVGHSNFSGSPSNRVKNIALGAKKVNMTLVAPGDEFSMLKTLGIIDGEHGWLPELVIKGNKTTPEFGGGLCQVGTTMFRAALASGMPITERQNHSYRVRYYEPAGTDATIYDPAPDFKFKNDTAHWLLVTTSIKDSEMAFTVWGTNDGRIAEQTTPRVYNIVSPPPKKIVETLDLPVGKEKCSETAHAGADVEFDYTVSYPDGHVEKRTFKSHYKPWQAVCLRGVTALTEPVPTGVDETGLNNPNL